MKDGNKESIKELLSALRTIAGIAISTVLLSCGLKARNELPIESGLFYVAITILTGSIITTIYLFLLAIVKIYDEEEDIIYLPDIRNTSSAAIFSFIVGNIILGYDLLF